MLKAEQTTIISGTLADLMATANRNSIADPSGSNARSLSLWEEAFAGKIEGPLSQFVAAPDGIGFLRFDDDELAKRFNRKQVAEQKILLAWIRDALTHMACKKMELAVKWSENKTRTIRIRSWEINREAVLSFDLP